MNYIMSAKVNGSLVSDYGDRTDNTDISIAFKHFGLASPLAKLSEWVSYVSQWYGQVYYTGVSTKYLSLLESASDSESTASYDDSVGVATCTVRVHEETGTSGSPEIVKFTLDVHKTTCASEIRTKLSTLLSSFYVSYACELLSVNIIVNGGT